ncbi:MAG: acyl-CoA dehydrogenase [Salinisphaera sp.]|nr:acyl-CoA dehydrogenase [Salinisphaera sp.]
MTAYQAPVKDMLFAMRELAGLEYIASLPDFEDASPDLVESILHEAARFGREVLDPLNQSGDQQGARLTEDGVVTADGFADAYGRFVAAGWNGVAGAPEFGGMGLPKLVDTATHEIWNGANMSFALCPILTASAVTLLARHGSDELKDVYLEKMVTGEWNGAMDLTEPQAGSDLAAVRSRAEPDGDDGYRVFGEKIFITWGENDAAQNTIHLVLARLPDAPVGVGGISLFLVPRYLPEADGSLGAHNDARCTSLEHKLGIHASPTCVMVYGENEGARGWLVGEPNRGLACMFTMMNAARHKIGVQGVGIAERALQQARAFAAERVQGKSGAAEQGAPINHHPDVRRMLLLMRSQTEAMRALCLVTAAAMDESVHGDDRDARERAQARLELLTPVVKGWCTEQAQEITSLGVQVHGGMGYIEETGAAQYLRDARILPIYEGTNGIQANDLIGRKLLRDQGAAMSALLADMDDSCGELGEDLRTPLAEAVGLLRKATDTLVERGAADAASALANAFDYMMLTGYVTGGWLMARAADRARQALEQGGDAGFLQARQASARFYLHQVLPRALGYERNIANGDQALEAIRGGDI